MLQDKIGLFSTGNVDIRRAILSALAIVARKANKSSAAFKSLVSNQALYSSLWVARFDQDEKNSKLATALWGLFQGQVSSSVLKEMSKHLSSRDDQVRDMTAKGIAAALLQLPDCTSSFSKYLIQTYTESLDTRRKLIETVTENQSAVGFDRAEAVERREEAVKHANETTWYSRDGVARALYECSNVSVPSLSPCLRDILPFIVTRCLFDPIDRVREMFVEAGCEMMNKYGKSEMNVLMPVLQLAFRDEEGAGTKRDGKAKDKQFAGVILMLSLLATHAENAKTSEILDTMILALRTPSALVQKAVAKHLPALIRKTPENAETIVEMLMKQLFEETPATYGSRRGGAYGLAGIVKGLRITALKKYVRNGGRFLFLMSLSHLSFTSLLLQVQHLGQTRERYRRHERTVGNSRRCSHGFGSHVLCFGHDIRTIRNREFTYSLGCRVRSKARRTTRSSRCC